MAASWMCGNRPKRTVWNYEPRMQRALDQILASRQFDLIQVEDFALGAYRYATSTPKVLTHYEVMRGRPVDSFRDASGLVDDGVSAPEYRVPTNLCRCLS